MAYSRHLTMEQIEQIWNNEKDNEFGVYIGSDLLIKGEFLGNSETDITADDIEEQEGDFSDNSYYLIMNAEYGRYSDFEEILDSEDLAFRYYYND